MDFDAILKQAQEVKPKLIVAGASAYSHIIDFSKFREIADAVGAKLMVDMAHIAGLVAAGLHQVQFLMHISRQRPLTRPFVALVEA